MKTSLEYFSRRGRLEAELTVALASCTLRFVETLPSVVEKERERLRGTGGPDEERLIDEATSPGYSRWEVVD